MKISKILMTTAVLLLFGSAAMFAANMAKAEKKEAAKVLKRTADVIMMAQKSVKKHKVFTGDLAKAYQHQQFAKELFDSRDYDKSVRQSLRARQLANQAIRSNKGRASNDFERDEKNYSKDMKSEDLDRDMDSKRKPSDKDMNDDAVVKLKINADFK